MSRVGQNHICTVYKQDVWQKITKYTIMYRVYMRFWPALLIRLLCNRVHLISQGTLCCVSVLS